MDLDGSIEVRMPTKPAPKWFLEWNGIKYTRLLETSLKQNNEF